MRLLRRVYLILLVLLYLVRPRDLVESPILWDVGYATVAAILRRFRVSESIHLSHKLRLADACHF
jgi:hypothetical protein